MVRGVVWCGGVSERSTNESISVGAEMADNDRGPMPSKPDTFVGSRIFPGGEMDVSPAHVRMCDAIRSFGWVST